MASITIKGDKALIQKLNNIAKVNLKENMVKATNLVHAQAKDLAPANKFGGGNNLQESIHQEVKQVGDSFVGRVYTNVQYAPFVEFGTGSVGTGTYPYSVKGLNLSYRQTPWVYTPDGGETFYRTSGQVAQPYMYPALKENEKKIKELLNKGILNAIKGGK